MKLSISNIAWDETHDLKMYQKMKEYRYTGLEIAPTRIFGENPYQNLKKLQSGVWNSKRNIILRYRLCSPFGMDGQKQYLAAKRREIRW